MPIPIPDGVEVEIKGSTVKVTGPRGELERTFDRELTIVLEGGELRVERPSDQRHHRALHGLTRALINNMVIGVHTGFSKTLDIYGVG